jgi:hypothetical protein
MLATERRGRWRWFWKSQLGFNFGFQKRKPVQRPGSRGGTGYYDEHGAWQYGDRPERERPAAEDPPTSRLPGPPLELTAPTPPAPAGPSRPAKAKTYAAGGRDWEVLEPEFVQRAIGHRLKQCEDSARIYRERAGDPASRLPRRKRDEYRGHADWFDREAAKIRSGDVEHVAASAQAKYRKIVKQAISTGQPVPDEVIGQTIEFRKARDARARYDKGRRTSFGNMTAGVDASMVEARGYKVKRQDGKPIHRPMVEEIAAGIDELESVLGPLADVFRTTQLTIAHTAGKHPFMRKAGGLFVPGENTVTIGIRGVPALAHEVGHMLDYAAGSATHESVTIFPGWGPGRKKRPTTSLAEIDYRTHPDTEGARLLRDAKRTMRDVYEVKRRMRTRLNAEHDEQVRDETRRFKVQLGDYWNDPVEIWARLVEQYVATKREPAGAPNDEHEGDPKAHSPRAYY